MSESEPTLRAVMGIVVGMILVDGKMPDSEVRWLMDFLPSHRLFEDVDPNDMARWCGATIDEAQRMGLPRAVEGWASRVPEHLRQSVFKLALAAVFADGKVAQGEAGMSVHLAELLNISDEEAVPLYKAARGY